MNNQKYSLNNRGAAIITVVLFFVVISAAVAVGLASPIVRDYKISKDIEKSKGAYYLSEAGHEDALYRIKQGISISSQEVLTLDGNTATTTITTVDASNKTIASVGDILQNTRRVKSALTTSTGASFGFGVQTGNGGITMANSSSITGNVYSNGPISGSGSNLITGTIVSAGPSGSILGVSSGSSAYAHTISNSSVGGNAYYQTKISTTVSGTSYPGSADQPTASLPITDETITQLETDAATGGTYATPCTITTPTTWTTRKVTCGTLLIKDKLTLLGMVWLTGNLEIANPSGEIKLDPSLGSLSAGFIVDNPSNRTTGSKITIKNSASFSGSGTSGSNVLLLSQNNSAELGGVETAISLENSATGDILLYTAHGKVTIGQSSTLKEVTAFLVSLANTANVTYSTGLANTLFVGSVGGSWKITDWKEGQ